MFESTPGITLEWVPAVLGNIPDQAVIFEYRSQDDAMYVANVIDGSKTEGGLYETNEACAAYLFYLIFTKEAKCLPTFEFLVVKHGT